jgi:hypothetical protein
MTTDLSNINLDFLPQTNQAIQGALYNPNCVTSQSCVNDLAALPNYFTTAVLSITFNANFTLDISQDKKSPSPFVRMQNVGNGGSLKLSGTECTNCGGGSSAPEPGTFLLLGSGLVAFGLLRRKRNA